MSRESYSAALKAGKKEIAACQAAGLPTTLPVLDQILAGKNTNGEVPLGLMDIPSAQLVGTKTEGRSTAFAPNFMPILERTSEFGYKWADLCDSHLREGIRDPIIAYEYLNKYYVLEGNKRVSVLKFFNSPSIPGYVTRILPAWEDTKEIRLYYEYLEFYNATSANFLSFSVEGSYELITKLVGYKSKVRWSFDDRVAFRSCYNRFEIAYRSVMEKNADVEITPEKIGDAFLSFVKLFGYEAVRDEIPDKMAQKLTEMIAELVLMGSDSDDSNKVEVVLDPQPDVKPNIFSQVFGVAHVSTFNVAFIHSSNPDTSSWTYYHELGKNYLDDTFGRKIRTKSFFDNETNDKAYVSICQAIKEGFDIIFTTSPELLNASLKAAVEYPSVKILNCSLDAEHKYIRTYYGRMFEAKYLTGMIAGIISTTDRIGYIADYPIAGVISNIDAFALGVKAVNPNAKIYLEWSTLKQNEGVDLPRKLYDLGAELISHQDMFIPKYRSKKYGLYKISENGTQNIAFPVWNWGKCYEMILKNISQGTWNTLEQENADRGIAYWWGLSSGVIELVLSDSIPAATQTLIKGLKNSICRYDFNPFSGLLHSQAGQVSSDYKKRMTIPEIMSIDWICDNVVGCIPTPDDLTDYARAVVIRESTNMEE